MSESPLAAAEFEVVACHGDHAGKAHLSVRRRSDGAEVAIRHMPFEADTRQPLPEEQARILAEAVRVVREAADFLQAESRQRRTWPTSPGEPPNVFGHPIGG